MKVFSYRKQGSIANYLHKLLFLCNLIRTAEQQIIHVFKLLLGTFLHDVFLLSVNI